MPEQAEWWEFKCDYCGRAIRVVATEKHPTFDASHAIETITDIGWVAANCSPPNCACPNCKPKHTTTIFVEERSDATSGPA